MVGGAHGAGVRREVNPFPVGIMQGRLSPPTNNRIQSFPEGTWREEFSKAKTADLSHIEWIFERGEWEKNPLSVGNGIEETRELIRESGVGIVSVCADYFLDIPYLRSDGNGRKELREKLEWLVVQSGKIGAKFIDLPFVDASAISGRDEFPLVRDFVTPALRWAEARGITIALETSLNPEDFRHLLLYFDHPQLMVNYDTGNSAGIGYDCAEELNSYGKWIRTVHIKDRKLHGTTVPLGTGNADFPIFFALLQSLRYGGPIVLQAAREGDETQTAIKNRKFVQRFLERRSC